MTVPASYFVSVNPGVIGSGGNPLSLNGVILTQNLLLSTAKVQSFSSAAAVSNFFGPASAEYTAAQTYFLGYDNSTVKPGTLYFAPYNLAARSAWLQSGSLAGMTLAQLQALNGMLVITVDGTTYESNTINLSAASSFSAAATTITSAFSPHLTCTWNSINSTFQFSSTTTGTSSTIGYAEGTEGTATTCTTTGTNLTIGGTVTGSFNVGDIVEGTDTTNTIPQNTVIVSQTSGTPGGAGVYVISHAATPGNLTSCTVSGFDYNGALAVGLAITPATGAILSQGAALDTPATAMANVILNTQNWVDFTTMWEPTLANKELFAVWTNAQNQRYAYIAWDTDAQAVVNGSTTCFGAVCKALAYDGVVPVYNTLALAVFVLGAVASINNAQENGRITAAYKSQSGFAPTVTDQQTLTNLIANGYSAYATVATANTGFSYFYNGQLSGKWKWLDTFVDQVYLNSQFQLALLTLLTQVDSIPYNQPGYDLISAAMADPIAAAINFGAIRQGVTLSALQVAEVNSAAGKNVAPIIFQQGYYLQVLDPGAQVRGNRGTPVINFWYADGGCIQNITLASIDIL